MINNMSFTYTDDDLLAAAEVAVKDSSRFFVASCLKGFRCQGNVSLDYEVEHPNGTFCYSFPIIKNGEWKCLRVWKSNRDIYREKGLKHIKYVSEYFSRNKIEYVIDYEYIDNAISLDNGVVLPVVLMGWVRGYSLFEFVRQNLKNATRIRHLANEFFCMCQYHKRNGMSHGDLSSKNRTTAPLPRR